MTPPSVVFDQAWIHTLAGWRSPDGHRRCQWAPGPPELGCFPVIVPGGEPPSAQRGVEPASWPAHIRGKASRTRASAATALPRPAPATAEAAAWPAGLRHRSTPARGRWPDGRDTDPPWAKVPAASSGPTTPASVSARGPPFPPAHRASLRLAAITSPLCTSAPFDGQNVSNPWHLPPGRGQRRSRVAGLALLNRRTWLGRSCRR
jgi:hypothetical protein